MSEDNFKKLAIPGFSNFIFNIYHKHLLLFLQSCGPGFESQTLHLRFFILIDLWCGKDENKWKRGRDWPILKKHIYYSSDTFFQNQMTWIQECYKTVIWRHTVRIRSSPICYIKLYRKDLKEAVNDLFTTLEERKINNCKKKFLFSETIGEQKLIFYRTMSWWVLTTSARAGRHSMSQHSISLYLIKSLRPPSFSD